MSFRFNHSREQMWGAVMRPASAKYIHLTPLLPQHSARILLKNS